LILGLIGEAHRTKCKRCTEKQKEIFKKVADWYKKNEPGKWELVLAKMAEDAKKAGS